MTFLRLSAQNYLSELLLKRHKTVMKVKLGNLKPENTNKVKLKIINGGKKNESKSK